MAETIIISLNDVMLQGDCKQSEGRPYPGVVIKVDLKNQVVLITAPFHNFMVFFEGGDIVDFRVKPVGRRDKPINTAKISISAYSLVLRNRAERIRIEELLDTPNKKG